jgi:hypothetical protein
MIRTASVRRVIHWKTEVDDIADYHQAVKAVVTVAPIFRIHACFSHV